MKTSGLLLRRAVGATLSLCLATSSVLAQKKPKAPAPPAPATPAAAAAPATPSAPTPMRPLSEVLTGQAKSDYEAGKLLYEDGDFAGASLKFKQAFEASKEVRLLWNMAACEKSLRHYGKVFKLVERYLYLGRSVLPEQEQKDAAAFLDAMKAFVSRVKITVSEPDATIAVDDETVGTSPLMDPVLLDMGPRKIRVTKPGFNEFVDTLQVPGASELAFAVTLEKAVHEGRIVVAAGPENVVYLDGKVVGQGRWEASVPSGTHTVRVTGTGMRPYQSELVLADKETRSLEVTLDPEAKKEGNGVIWWVVGGVVAASAAGSIVYFATRNKETTAASSGSIVGTIQPGSVQLVFRRGFAR